MKKSYEDFVFGVLFILIIVVLLSLTVGIIYKIDNIKAETEMFKSMTELNSLDIKTAKLYLSDANQSRE